MSLSTWVQLCEAIGINARQYEAMEAYLLAGKIIDDKVVSERKRELLTRDSRERRHHAHASLEVIRMMTKAERIALRERVTGVVPMSQR